MSKNLVGVMSYEKMGEQSLNHSPCRYGESRLLFRGPRRNLNSDYLAILGGTETYGKYIHMPYPALLEQELGATCVNFGLLNAGVDAFLHDTTVIEAAQGARVTVVQVTGAQNNSNRLYSVHPRRNDRFVKPSRLMQQMFRELDYTDYHFTRHLLQAVRRQAPDRYGFLCEELRQAWIARMTNLLRRVGGPILLLWFADHAPGETGDERDPMFIDRRMIEEIRPLVTDYIEVVSETAAIAAPQDGGRGDIETLAAAGLLPSVAHEQAARAILRPLQSIIAKQERPAF